MSDLAAFDRLREALKHAATIEEVRLCEAQAAAIYWNAWRTVPLRLRGRDLARMPAHWARYDSRASVLTGAPRAATNPVNALLNYLYALLESESRLALLAVGLDPTLGVLHADQRNRDSFALDAMEPVRPDVDAFVLDLLEERSSTSRDFGSSRTVFAGSRAPLTHELALTLPHGANACGRSWRTSRKRFANPWSIKAQRLARSRLNPRISVATLLARSDRRYSQRLAKPRSRGHMRRNVADAHHRSAPTNPVACALCGEPVLKRRRRHCELACRRRGASTDCERSKRLAWRSQRKPLRATIHAAAPK